MLKKRVFCRTYSIWGVDEASELFGHLQGRLHFIRLEAFRSIALTPLEVFCSKPFGFILKMIIESQAWHFLSVVNPKISIEHSSHLGSHPITHPR